MYLYIDESGNFNWPLGGRSETVGIFVILVVKDNESRKRLRQVVNRARINFQKWLSKKGQWPKGKKVIALKGSAKPEKEEKGVLRLNNHPNLRLWLFRRIVEEVRNLNIHVLFINKKKFKQTPSETKERTYSQFLRVIINTLSVPKTQRKSQMILDKYFVNVIPRKTLDQMLISFWITRINLRGWLHIHHGETEEDKGLQLVDIVANFCYQYKRLKLDKRPQDVSLAEIAKMEIGNKQWFETFYVLKPMIKVWQENPEIKPGKLKPPYKIS